ncbi:MAG: BppU family phage baseplate upper protein [Vagococcus sp.]|uniref:BppU family phage baseplate upper protein n=1 Tax=Vagococcus sp. TaxID=1933889 RepID=UPI002FCBB73F
MSNYDLKLSTTQPNHVEFMEFRQDDILSRTLNVAITSHDLPRDLTGYDVFLNSTLPSRNIARDKVTNFIDKVNGKFSYTLIDSFVQDTGRVVAWFSIEKSDSTIQVGKVIDSTTNFSFSVVPGYRNCVKQGNYIWEFEELKRHLMEVAELLGEEPAVELASKIIDLENRLYESNLSIKSEILSIKNEISSLIIEIDIKLATKRDKTTLITMSDMGQDVREAMTGGSVAVVGVDAVGTVNIRNAAVDSNKISDGYNFRGVLENNEDLRLLTKNGIYLALNNTKIPAEYGGSALVELKKGAGRWSELILTPLATTAAKSILSKYRCVYDSTNVTGNPVWTLESSDFKGVVDNVNVDTIIVSGTYLITNPKIEGFIIPNGNLYVMSTNGRFISQTLYGSDGNAYFRRWDNNGAIPKFKKLKIETDEGGASGANLTGQTIVNIGDSIFGALRPPHDISTAISDKTGAVVHNLGFGGCMMAKRIDREDQTQWDAWSWYALSYAISTGDFTQQDDAIGAGNTLPAYFRTSYNLLKAMDWSQVNIITCGYGTNDWTYSEGGSSIMLDNESDKKDVKTLLGAFRYGAELIWETYPHISIVVVSPTYRFWLNDDLSFIEDSDTKIINNQKLSEFVEGLGNVSKEYKISFIDNYFEANINKQNRINFFDGKDGTHHNSKGTKLLGRRIGGELMKVF